MKKATFFLCMLCGITLHAQTVTDRIFLTDSVTVYEGLMVEQSPARYIKILRFKEKDTIQVMLKDIWKMVKVYPAADTVKMKPKRGKNAERNARTAFAELLGNGVFYSVNFEQRLHKKGMDGWGLRVGLNVIRPTLFRDSGRSVSRFMLGIPLGVNYLFGEKKHFLEWGAGVTYFIGLPGNGSSELTPNNVSARLLGRELKTSRVMGNFTLGYRHIVQNNGLVYGAAFVPVIGNDFFLPLVSVKFGYQF